MPGRPGNTLTEGRQHCCSLGSHSQPGANTLVLTTGQTLTSLPKKPQGKICGFHFLSTSASFFTSLKISYFHRDLFLFSPNVAVVLFEAECVTATCTTPSCGTHRSNRPSARDFSFQRRGRAQGAGSNSKNSTVTSQNSYLYSFMCEKDLERETVENMYLLHRHMDID